ncbi:hypothetical protein KIPE111705_26245 [Kibdelosporangium persicum]|uniref:DUF222 domain-containing protein n=1 Tax=Kibdelosporangium persicum TaxID=2698649 RepID=A0ABX2F3K9_9PSEU|nr:hypothetical protein [Kibdelosporangium persicum]NRN65492.1 hypothetical protein [Kibdelosporangium persicum]
MVNVVKVLDQQLRTVDPLRGKVLSLAFAEHVLDVCAAELTPEQQDLSTIYLRAAKALFSGEASMTALADASDAHAKIRVHGSRLAEEIMWVAVLAVSVCWQRDLVREGLSRGELKNLTVRTVAAEAQQVVRLCTGGQEATWQLTHLVATAEKVDPQVLINLMDEVSAEHAQALAVEYARHALEARPNQPYFQAVLDDPGRLPLPVVVRQAQHAVGGDEATWQLIRLIGSLPR